MMAFAKFRSILALAVGFGFYRLGHTVGVWGDLDVLVGDRSAALMHHSVALLFTLLALGCFLFAGFTIVREWRGGGSPPEARGRCEREVPTPPAFDPDAVMARYLATRDAGPSEVATKGFGRKRA